MIEDEAIKARMDENAPFTVVFSRRVRRGYERQFEAWAKDVTREAHKFPGHLGASFIRPADHAHPEYVIIFQFDSYDHLKDWFESEVRQRWLEQVKPLIEGEVHVEEFSGLEYWFTPPGNINPAAMQMPPRYKQVMISWLAVVPLTFLVSMLLRPLVMPDVLMLLIQPAIVLTLMAYVVMPRLSRLFAFWLFRKPDSSKPM
jgi:uncharacterized protein